MFIFLTDVTNHEYEVINKKLIAVNVSMADSNIQFS